MTEIFSPTADTAAAIQQLIGQTPGPTGATTWGGGARHVTHVRVTADNGSGGSYPCVPTAYDTLTGGWTEYRSALVIPPNTNQELITGNRYIAVRYGTDADGVPVYVTGYTCCPPDTSSSSGSSSSGGGGGGGGGDTYVGCPGIQYTTTLAVTEQVETYSGTFYQTLNNNLGAWDFVLENYLRDGGTGSPEHWLLWYDDASGEWRGQFGINGTFTWYTPDVVECDPFYLHFDGLIDADGIVITEWIL